MPLLNAPMRLFNQCIEDAKIDTLFLEAHENEQSLAPDVTRTFSTHEARPLFSKAKVHTLSRFVFDRTK